MFSPEPWAGFLIHEAASRKLKEELWNAVPRLCAHDKRDLGDVSSVLSNRVLWPNKFRKFIPRHPCTVTVHTDYEKFCRRKELNCPMCLKLI